MVIHIFRKFDSIQFSFFTSLFSSGNKGRNRLISKIILNPIQLQAFRLIQVKKSENFGFIGLNTDFSDSQIKIWIV